MFAEIVILIGYCWKSSKI